MVLLLNNNTSCFLYLPLWRPDVIFCVASLVVIGRAPSNPARITRNSYIEGVARAAFNPARTAT